MSEVLEFARLSANAQFSAPTLAKYRLIYAMLSADVGRLHQARDYAQLVHTQLSQGDKSAENDVLAHHAEVFLDRVNDLLGARTAGRNSSWMSFGGVLNKFAAALVGSPANKQQQQKQRARAVSHASTASNHADAGAAASNNDAHAQHRHNLAVPQDGATARAHSTPQATAQPAIAVKKQSTAGGATSKDTAANDDDDDSASAKTKKSDNNEAKESGAGLLGSMFSVFSRTKSTSKGKTAKMGEDLQMEYNKEYKMWLPKVNFFKIERFLLVFFFYF